MADRLDRSSIKEETAIYNLQTNDDDESQCPNKKTHFYEFKEFDLVIQLIVNIPKNIEILRDKERSFEQFLFICDSYQEQPHLVDPILMVIFEKLIGLVKSCLENEKDTSKNLKFNNDIINESFKYMYTLCKMRGYKKIVQYLPHEVNDFEPVLNLLARQNISDVNTWHTRYMLLLWLSIVCMIPFDLNRFDANIGENENDSIMNRFLKICIPYLFATDKCQDASAFLLAKFMSRIDLKNIQLPVFFQKLFDYLRESKISGENIKQLGSLKCIANIYKYGKREDLLPYTLPTLQCIVEQDLLGSVQFTLIRKFHIKIIQRIGTTFFKSKVAKWRYERGSRVLMNNLNKQQQNIQIDSNIENLTTQEEDDDEKIPNEIEEIIEQLLHGLRDKDTIVRWSSAKGIGRITNRLPRDMAEDVLSSVIDLFSFVEDDSAWHGGCLAIAELGRRGLLLPQQLPIVVPIILKALVFDKKLGNYSLGRNVRDAACYVCWSFARAFEPNVIHPYVNKIAGSLLIVTVFDREVNCRRAASAAFQENVGRQGQFPHGIDILTKCDYYAVGQIQNCYLNLSLFIAGFEEYKVQLIDHLLEHKFNHWDQSIREYTSLSLYNLAKISSDYVVSNVLPQLLKHSFSIDINTRHGSLLCLAELLHSLCEDTLCSNETKSLENFHRYFTSDFITELKLVIGKIFDEKYFRGSGVEYMRLGVCYFIKKLALSKLFQLNEHNSFKLDQEFFTQCELFLSQCLEYNKEIVQIAAVEALPYYLDLKFLSDKQFTEKLFEETNLVETYIHSVKSTSKEFVRSGYCLALGNMPIYFLILNDNLSKILDMLMISSKWIMGPINTENTKNNENEPGWVFARRDSIKAIISILKQVKSKEDLKQLNLSDSMINEIFECFFHGLNDYSIDSKGDSGSRVREISIEGLETLIEMCAKYGMEKFSKNNELITRILGGIMQQAVERIDRQRCIAGKSFENLLYNEYVKLDAIKFISEIRSVFKKSDCKYMDWNIAQSTLPLFSRLLHIDELQIYLLIGFIYSIGSLTESLVKSATSSFLKQLQHLKSTEDTKIKFKNIIDNILQLCRTHLKSDRLSSSLVKTVDLIIQNGYLNDEMSFSDNYPLEFLNLFLENVKFTKDMSKLNSYIDLFCDMLQFEKDRVRERSMIQLMIMLCHSFPIIRKTTATKLFETLINYAEIFEKPEDYDECVVLLTESVWDKPVSELRPIRNRICDLTKTPKPVMKTQQSTQQKDKNNS